MTRLVVRARRGIVVSVRINEVPDLFTTQLASRFLRRHLQVVVGVTNGFDQPASVGVTGHDGRFARLAAFEHAFPAVEQ